jgi:hypothetical protein
VISRAIFKEFDDLQEGWTGRKAGQQRDGQAADKGQYERETAECGAGESRSSGLSGETAGWIRLPNPVSVFGIWA